MKWFGIGCMAALLATAPGYGSAQQPQEKAPAPQSQSPEVGKKPATAATSFTPAEMKAYEEKTAGVLEEVQEKIADLRGRAAAGPPQRKRSLILTANNLQFQKVAAENRLAALKKATGTAWGQQKAELDKAMQDLRKACEHGGVPLK